MPESLLESAVAIAKKIPKQEAKLDTIIALLPRLTGEARQREFSSALRATRALDEPVWQSQALKKLAALVPTQEDSLLKEALDAACRINVPSERAAHLAELSFQLPPLLRKKALQEGLSAARIINDVYQRVQAQAKIAPPLSDIDWENLFVEAQSIPAAHERFRMFTWLAPHLQEPSRGVALRKALETLPRFSHPGVIWRLLQLLKEQRQWNHLYIRTAELPRDVLHSIIGDCLHFSVRSSREQLLTNLLLLAPVIQTLGCMRGPIKLAKRCRK